MLLLRSNRRDVLETVEPFLFGCRPHPDAALAAVVGDADVVVHDHVAVDVGVVDDGRVHIQHGGVIAEDAAIPAPADEACAEVAEAVVDASIETDLRSPEARVEYFEIVDPLTLAPVDRVRDSVLVVAAMWMGTTRLIDNMTWPRANERT